MRSIELRKQTNGTGGRHPNPDFDATAPLERAVDDNSGGKSLHRLAPIGEFIEADQADATCPAVAAKINRFAFSPNQIHKPRRPALLKRGVSRSSRTLGAGCGGRFGAQRRTRARRTAKSC